MPLSADMSPNTLSYTVVDAFAVGPFTGNPAAVIILSTPLSEDLMLKIAAEFNLAETAFAVPTSGADASVYDLRWFTPTHEVSLCGHATLATAHVLAAQRDSTKAEQFTFHTLSGPLIATRKNGADDNTYELDFPADDLVAVNSAERGAIETSVHTAVGGRARVVDVHRSGRNDLIVELAMHEGARLQDFDIDLNALSELRGRGVALTTATTSVNETDAHFHSRFFSLSSPLVEDPATGSAHCSLAPLYTNRCGGPNTVLRATQGGPRRQGALEVVWDGKANKEGGRVKLRGRCVSVANGTLYI